MKFLKPWTIYLWIKNETVKAASPIVTKDGIKEIYQCAWNAGQSPDKKDYFTAKSYCKKQMRGTMNILNWFGRKALNEKGNIDNKRLNELFGLQAVRADLVGKYPEDIFPEIKFPIKEITLEKARELKLE